MFLLFLAQSVEGTPAPVSPDIVVTAARTPEDRAATAASVSVIDEVRLRRLEAPLADALLRLAPSTAVAGSGPAGSLSEVRIRGAEANHTLLFIDGIRANDPAAGNTPRFELLNADLFSRIEVVRGPQSALWGSEAIGGVVAIDGDAGADTAVRGTAEAGSRDFARAAVDGSLREGPLAVAGAVAWQGARGIDSFGGGDRDGYRNRSARLRASVALAPAFEVGASGFQLRGTSEYDGVDLLTFQRADTLDVTRNRLAAGRLWARFGEDGGAVTGRVAGSLLGSRNRNLLDGEELNRTRGSRRTLSGQVDVRFSAGRLANIATLAIDADRERFRARDEIYGGATNQSRSREHTGVTGEWQATLAPARFDLAIRHDRFSDFADATTVRASARVDLPAGFAVTGAYGEGIAQPTFFDLYGFFPGNYVGNPDLRPERSKGFEAALRYRRDRVDGAITVFRQRLRDEIVASDDFLSTVNGEGVSRRWGVEAEGALALSDALRITANYAYLQASDTSASGSPREVRRPKHSGSVALDGAQGRFSYGAALTYTGARTDVDFDLFPAQTVRLGGYWLGGGRLAYRLTPRLEAFGRVSNAFGSRYQDVVGYRTEGRAVFAGIRLASGR